MLNFFLSDANDKKRMGKGVSETLVGKFATLTYSRPQR